MLDSCGLCKEKNLHQHSRTSTVACGVLPHNKLVLGSNPRQALFVKFVNALEATYYKTIYSAEAIS